MQLGGRVGGWSGIKSASKMAINNLNGDHKGNEMEN